MTLDEYLTAEKEKRGLTEKAFAELIGTSQPHVNRLRNGAWPSRTLADKIRKATMNRVTPDDWLGPFRVAEVAEAEARAQ